jgi:hypothetical protein
MEKTIREFSARKFSAEDMSLIVKTTKLYPKLSQYEMASTICELLGWQTPSGRAKYLQCIRFLHQLEKEGLITLPAVRARKQVDVTKSKRAAAEGEIKASNHNIITECGAIKLEIVRRGKGIARWREYLSAYHALGDKNVYGSQIRYMITSEGIELGCMLFSASSWALAPREKWIGWNIDDKKHRLHLIINNARFILFPWIRVRNLASRALSIASKQIRQDWLDEYCYAPVLMETFVEPPHLGTIYKASNWVYLGETQGRGRNDRYNENALTRKAIFMYPLQRDFRDVLMGKIPWKAVGPHE